MNEVNVNNYMYWDLLHGLDDLESSTFREHWYYRARCFWTNTNASMNPDRRWEYEHLMDHARKFEEERRL